VYSAGFSVNLKNGEVFGQWGVAKGWPANSFAWSGSATFGTILGYSDAAIVSNFLVGGGTQVSAFSPGPFGVGVGGGLSHSYGGKYAIEVGVGVTGVGYSPLSYGYKDPKK
jgi:filamentous hemagglutinin